MANRHLSRSIVMQSLFELDFRELSRDALPEVIGRNAKEFAPGITDISFITGLAEGVLDKQSSIDEVIEKAAPEWPMAQIATVDRNILRVGLYELLYGNRDEVPPKVAINEAIELAKTFGGETSGRFVNGVLGTIYKEMGEPGKEETAKKGKKKEFIVEKLGGALVYALSDGVIYVALVHDIFGYWTLPKGRLEEDESEEQATAREVKEEIGIDVDIGKSIGRNEYIASDPARGKIRKQVAYFLAKTDKQELHLKESGGLNNAAWFPIEELLNIEMYDDIRPLVAKGINLMTASSGSEKLSLDA